MENDHQEEAARKAEESARRAEESARRAEESARRAEEAEAEATYEAERGSPELGGEEGWGPDDGGTD